MKIDEACISCIINQSSKVASAIKADEALKEKLILAVTQSSKDFSFSLTPPEVATDVYELMSILADKADLYEEIKNYSTQNALSYIPFLEDKISKSQDKLLTATKIAVAGNVIDLAAEVEFDLADEIEKIFETDFGHDDFEKLKEMLADAKTLLVIGDNAGEHIFDYLFIQTLQQLYPLLYISYMVRGNPIINDVTMKEAKEAGFEKLCNLVDSGVNTPGFVYNRANEESQQLFDEVDVVVTKGMGNYECLSPSPRKNLCYLLKVKCSVVASSLQRNIGDIVCKTV
ncbi:MAG: ARMT1-like domain-containing protein [Thiovulaceae bacterium]|nr:ARMT1-like domain-containing protein [Sulfurimonadaceae bacterium]